MCLNSHYLMKPILMNSHSSCMKDVESEVPVQFCLGKLLVRRERKFRGKREGEWKWDRTWTEVVTKEMSRQGHPGWAVWQHISIQRERKPALLTSLYEMSLFFVSALSSKCATNWFLQENAFLLKNTPILHTHSSISYGQNCLYTAGHTYTHPQKWWVTSLRESVGEVLVHLHNKSCSYDPCILPDGLFSLREWVCLCNWWWSHVDGKGEGFMCKKEKCGAATLGVKL